MTASALDDATLAAWRAEAAADRNPFTDPALIRQAETVLARVSAEWLSRVVGHPAAWWGRLDNHELIVAVRAAEADAGYFQALATEQDAVRAEANRVAAGKERAAAAAERAAWEELRSRLPVLADVCHNWTARHVEGYEQGGNHIVVLSGFTAGRLRRGAGQPLCWTLSRAHELRYVYSNAGDEDRLPDCKACLRTARRLADGFR